MIPLLDVVIATSSTGTGQFLAVRVQSEKAEIYPSLRFWIQRPCIIRPRRTIGLWPVHTLLSNKLCKSVRIGAYAHHCASPNLRRPNDCAAKLRKIVEQMSVASPHHLFKVRAGLLPRLNEFSQMPSQFWMLSGIEQSTEPFQIFFALFAQDYLLYAPMRTSVEYDSWRVGH